jgi:protein involved in polysaccharide export with SLBB domain
MTPEIRQRTKQFLEPSESEQTPPDFLEPSPTLQSPEEITEELSEFEQFIAGKVDSTISTDIKQFGYDLFRMPPSTFAPASDVPVGPAYVIGPGDGIIITVWGKIEGRWTVVVDRDGNISLPKMGVIGVTGLTFSELKDLLRKEISKYYSGFEMNVSMDSLRTIKVYVVGNAKRPGGYIVSSLSTLVNALFASGGPDKTGTMRNIQLKRNGKTITPFDMYDFLLKGDKTKDVKLMPEDVVFIPPVGQMVGIAGNVKRPAIYELHDKTRLLELITMAGGLTSTAFKGRVQVQRIHEHQFITLFEGDLVDIENNADKNFTLQDGDLIKVFSIVETENTVRLVGAVVTAGEYAIVPGETRLSGVISRAGGLLYYASDKAELTRVSVTQSGPVTELLHIDISKAVKGDPEHNILLEINDYLFIRTVPEWKLYKTVSIKGEVKYPGTYTVREGETLSSLIERAGGYTGKAYLRGAIFTREEIRQIQQTQIDEMISRLEIEIMSQAAVETATVISADEAKIKELETKQKSAFIEKLRSIKAKGRMAIILNKIETLKGTPYDIELAAGDSLNIPANPQSVQVLGAVYNRTAFVYDKQRNVPGYIDLAGGYTDNADKKKIYILKVDGTAVRPQEGLLSILWNKNSNRWEFGYDNLEPGDTIVVPEKLERIAWMRQIKDITQILYQIATAAGVLIVAF